MSYIIGSLIILAVFTVIFITTAKSVGLKETSIAFGVAIVMTAIFAFAALLVTGGIKF